MRKKTCFIFVLVGILLTSVGCGHDGNTRNYQIDYYLDTIQSHIIISAVCSKKDGISISSINVGTVTQTE
jgi:hypothetical protein